MAFFLVCRRSHITSHPFIFSSLFSSATSEPRLNPNQSESASNFLLNDLGLSSSEISKVRRIYPLFFTRESPLKRSVQSVQLFRSYGFTDPQLKKMFSQCPALFGIRADQVLRPRLQLVKALGFSNEDLAKTLSRAPRTLSAKYLEGNIAFYKAVYLDNANLVKALKINPSFLARTPQASSVNERTELLQQYGFGNDSINYIMRRAPLFLSAPIHKMQSHLKFFRKIGFKEPNMTFANALSITVQHSSEMLHQKYRHLVALGLSEHEVKEMILKCPSVLKNSCDKVQRIADYLQSKRVKLGVLIACPLLCGMSLEKKIIPRYNAFLFLSKTLGQEKAPSFKRLIQITEIQFMKKYVEGKPHAKKLLKVYRGDSKAPPQ